MAASAARGVEHRPFHLDERIAGPHGGVRIATAGVPAGQADAALILCHGRGAGAEDMLSLRAGLEAPATVFVAPRAAGRTWYPYSFLAPLEDNEPHLSSALELLGGIVEQLARQGIPPTGQILLGFSQGGCLALEFAGRNARRFGGVVGLSAGLIGPPGRSWDFEGSLEGTPVFLGCGARDPHIPEDRLKESARELERIAGEVELQVYPGLGHAINRDELDRVQAMLDRILDQVHRRV